MSNEPQVKQPAGVVAAQQKAAATAQPSAADAQLKHITSNPCIKSLKAGEPFFVLKATDQLSASVIRYWVKLAEAAGTPHEKTQQALELANQFEHHPGRKTPD